MNDLMLGVQLMSYGLAGVFIVLILFYVMIVVLKLVFPVKQEDE